MSDALVLGVVALTSIVAIVVFRRAGIRRLAAAGAILLEAIGATVLFFLANVTIAATLVLLSRRFWLYTSLYDASDISLLLLSLLQAVTLTIWFRARTR